MIIFTLIFSIYFLFIVMIIAMIKNYIIDINRQKAINIIFNQKNWPELHKKYLTDNSYGNLFLNPFKWTFKQMYPGLKNNEKIQ